MIPYLFDSDRLVGDLTQKPCSSRQADAALDFSRTEVTENNDTDSLKTLGEIPPMLGRRASCIGGQKRSAEPNFAQWVGWRWICFH